MYIYSHLFCLYKCKDYCHRVTTQLQLVVVVVVVVLVIVVINGKAVPLQAWCGSEGSMMGRFPDFIWTTAQDGGKFGSLTHRPPLPTVNNPGTHFC